MADNFRGYFFAAACSWVMAGWTLSEGSGLLGHHQLIFGAGQSTVDLELCYDPSWLMAIQ